MDQNSTVRSITDKMRSVRAACDNAVNGAKKELALDHYRAAKQALAGKHEGECNRELDSASYALE